jgi:hypothetical protein
MPRCHSGYKYEKRNGKKYDRKDQEDLEFIGSPKIKARKAREEYREILTVCGRGKKFSADGGYLTFFGGICRQTTGITR